jgi:two-component system chemotaxis sensor kinase CheA
MDVSKYLDLYLTEGRDHVSRLRAGLPKGAPPDPGQINELFRSAHSLKGMAASMGFENTSKLAHRLEGLFDRWRQGQAPTAREERAAVAAVDALDALLDQVQQTSSDAGAVVDPMVSVLLGEDAAPAKGVPGPKPEPQEALVPTMLLSGSIDTASPLPLARLMVVAERIKASFPGSRMEPGLETLRSQGLRKARFHVAATQGVIELARTIRELPEVAEVDVEEQAAIPAPRQTLIRTVRVRSEDLDDLLDQAAELLHHQNLLEAELQEAESRRRRFWLEANRAKLNRLFDQVLAIRLVSFDAFAERLGRVARELSSRFGKPLAFSAEGVEVQADRTLVERLLDPLLHLVRNAVDHGIEPAKAREAAGKPAEGNIRLSIRRDSEALLISLEDDGRGLDAEAIRQAAVDRGLYTPGEASALDREKLLELLTLPAFSTRREVTDVSGRGVGLDVVRSAVESLGGHLEMASERGRGSRFTLVIPSAATLTRVLVFGWEDSVRYGIPTSQIRRIYPLSQFPLVWSGNRRHLQAQDDLLPVLSWRQGPVGRDGYGFRISAPGTDRVLLVSKVYQAERVVVLPLGAPLEMVPEWMGGALLATGEVAYILDGRVLAKREGEEQRVS